MDDHVAQVAAKLDAIAVPLGLERMESLGEDGSGAYGFYAVRLRRGTIFSDYEMALARALLAWPRAPRTAHEIGGGFGGLAILLAALGFETVCLEVDAKRFAAAEGILGAVKAEARELGGRCEMVNARFPTADGKPPASGAMALITNLVFTTTEQAKAQILAGLRAYPVAIIDVDRFLAHCRSPEERAARLDEFDAAGLFGEPFLDLGASACFYRFFNG
ncbi:MAG: hypothetical protein M3T55_07220 [Pseudomonadota bacterium]|nr:hypothetical protein [Pseudomonadota bacterium]